MSTTYSSGDNASGSPAGSSSYCSSRPSENAYTTACGKPKFVSRHDNRLVDRARDIDIGGIDGEVGSVDRQLRVVGVGGVEGVAVYRPLDHLVG